MSLGEDSLDLVIDSLLAFGDKLSDIFQFVFDSPGFMDPTINQYDDSNQKVRQGYKADNNCEDFVPQHGGTVVATNGDRNETVIETRRW